MKRFSTHSPLRASALAVAGLLALAPGCVTRGTHDRVVRERDDLRAAKRSLETEVERLSASNESLGVERLKLLDEMEDLREKRAVLERDVRRLARSEEKLAKNLAANQAELASRRQELGELRGTYEGLVGDLEAEVATGQIQIEQLREGLRVNLSQEVLFASGSPRVSGSGGEVLKKVSARLKDLTHRIEVQGHTDDVPIRESATNRYPSNWELAAARASDVVRLMAASGVDPSRMTAVSFGEYAPVGSNETPEGRARNRRIEIRLHPNRVEPVAAAPDEAADAPSP